MRKGPYPLSTHISMAAAALTDGGDAAWQAQAMQSMLLGIRAYQMQEWRAERRALRQIWQAGEVTLSVNAAIWGAAERPAVLLIPSMINRSYILDLMPGRSMMECFESLGLRPVLLDWGCSVDDAGQANLEAVILQRLVPAIEYLAEQTARPVHVLGYCMGGTLLAAAASRLQHKIARTIFLAAPWDFHAGTQTLLSRVKFWVPSVAALMRGKTCLPMEWVQMVFASLNPVQSVQKFTKFAAMDPESEEAKTFIAVEDWLNDGVDLPVELGTEVIEDWFVRNIPMHGQWMLRGQAVKASEISCPVLVVTSGRDKLVEEASALALASAIPGAQILQPLCGHIGMIAGQNAVQDVWLPMAEWILRKA